MQTMVNVALAAVVVIGLLVAGVVANGRVNGLARGLMWAGIALVCVARVANLALPYLAAQRRMVQSLGALSLILGLLGSVGVVMLAFAVGAAARGGHAASTRYPGPRGDYGQPPSGPYGYPPAPPQNSAGQWSGPREGQS